MNWIIFFWDVLKSALFSTGGYGPLPSLHSDFIAEGWAKEKHFTEAISIGQVTPGPNGLWVISLCFLIAGWQGALLAIIALVLPPLVVLIVQRLHVRIADLPATQGLLDGVVLAIIGVNIIVLSRLFWSNGLNLLLTSIAVGSAFLAITRRVPVVLIMLAAAVIGVLMK